MPDEMFKPGDEVGEFYEVKGVLGSGGFAYVYRAVERRLDREVALKVMSPDRVETEDDGERLRQRFLREARHVSKLDSPHAVTLHDHDILPDGRLYMVLEYVDGRTLDKVLESSGGMSADRIHRILVQLLDVLAEAHDAGILHRDVKPSNVMLHERRDGEDWLKLLDFGIAKKVASEGTDDDVTREGQLVGTPQYMSPEQLRQFPTTPASDLFSVGLLVYEMWAGRSPFASTDIIQIYDRMKQFRSDLGELV
jgi:serine/threonine-protein kinase